MKRVFTDALGAIDGIIAGEKNIAKKEQDNLAIVKHGFRFLENEMQKLENKQLPPKDRRTMNDILPEHIPPINANYMCVLLGSEHGRYSGVMKRLRDSANKSIAREILANVKPGRIH